LDIEILNPDRLRYWCDRIAMPTAGVDALVKVAISVNSEPEIRQLFSEFHQKNVLRGEWHREYTPIPFDPLLQNRYGSQTSLFYLLAYLSALPFAEREYLRRGIDLAIFTNTMQDVSTWYRHEYDLTGIWEFKMFHWIWRSLSCVLFRLGRLQFVLTPFDGDVRAFRKSVNGEILLLADPQVPLRPDGNAYGAGGTTAQTDELIWHPVFEESETRWRGNPVSPYGQVEKNPICLPRTEWQLILQQGDTVLDLHIPRFDPFTAADCRESMYQAYDFFARQFPEQPFKASYCHTWFFTPQLQLLLPRESNLVRFQREFYLYPFPGGPGFLWEYVFGERYPVPAGAPRDTSLRRAVLDWLEQGGELFDLPGVRFHDPQDWGSQPYMSEWDQHHAPLPEK
jgi:hypothetical protein